MCWSPCERDMGRIEGGFAYFGVALWHSGIRVVVRPYKLLCMHRRKRVLGRVVRPISSCSLQAVRQVITSLMWYGACTCADDPTRQMISTDDFNALDQGLATTKTKWQIIGTGTVQSTVYTKNASPSLAFPVIQTTYAHSPRLNYNCLTDAPPPCSLPPFCGCCIVMCAGVNMARVNTPMVQRPEVPSSYVPYEQWVGSLLANPSLLNATK
jgi:hypothetical protein